MFRLLSISCCFFLTLWFCSCKKKDITYSFSGLVKESVENLGLSGVSVKISQRVYDGNSLGTAFNQAASITTNADGFFETTFDREKVVEFKIELSKTNYFELTEIISSSQTSTENNNVFVYTLEPKSWVTFHLVNVDGHATDEFTMIKYNFKEGCDGCGNNEFSYYSGDIDSTFTYVTTGGEYARYSYKNPGGSFFNNDSVYTTLFDTAFVTIEY